MTKRKKAAAGSGGKTVGLNEAAFQQVDEHASAIVEGLINNAKKGNCLSIRLLLELAEAGADARKALEEHPLLSLAMRLAMQPEMPAGAVDGKPGDEKPTQN